MGRKKKKPLSKLETVKAIVEILAGIASIASAVYMMLKG